MVSPTRLPGWVGRFSDRHPGVTLDVELARVTLTGADGARATWDTGWGGLSPDAPRTSDQAYAHAAADRRVAVLLARRAAHAVGVFDGPRLTVSKVDTHYVQARTAAGGWSQQRYARRRSQQAENAARAAAADLRRVVWSAHRQWDWFVTGGDSAAVRAVLAHVPELAERAPARVLPTPDPRLAVLRSFPDTYRAVTITLNELA